MPNNQPPAGYTEEDIQQQGPGLPTKLTPGDVRAAFQHDVDRILYSTEFRNLAGKTQVIASDQLGGYHNRLTHSLKVAQIAKRMAVLLTERFNSENGTDLPGPDPDLVEAAALLHDIGHPPFGHVGEEAIRSAVVAAGRNAGMFQANAQNLRIATYLSIRRNRGHRGLNLTRASLDAAIKYPWMKGPSGYGESHWGCYDAQPDLDALRWVMNDPAAPYDAPTDKPQSSDPKGPRRPVEEQIMDWADEITYACHDLEDFYRAGMVPLDRILSGVPRADGRAGEPKNYGPETGRVITYLTTTKGFEEARALKILQGLQNLIVTLYPFEATRDGKGRSTSTVGTLIGFFMGPKPEHFEEGESEESPLRLELQEEAKSLTRYGATLYVHEDLRDTARVLSAMIWCYVIDRRSLATQQGGQKRILTDLIKWYAEDKRLLPQDRLEEMEEHGDGIRAAVDAVASLTESEAIRLHRRMSGIDWGQITDL